MEIDSYIFGEIKINGKTFTSDIIIFPDGRILDSWKRKEDHRLSADDISSLIASRPKVIIAGTGMYGILKPDENLKEILQKQGIEFFAYPTRKAIKLYNKIDVKEKAGACFHLSC